MTQPRYGLPAGKSAQCAQMSTTGVRGAASRQYLTRSQVARLPEVSPATIARWTREGKLPFVRTLGGQRRYRRALILDVIRRSHEG
jgi:excisionase family DNA binding protein